ncbi:esterase/lipase family protein [Estrella lausannensis]|nr:alpha/beta fold hydrolase [Estrella lausannensis]
MAIDSLNTGRTDMNGRFPLPEEEKKVEGSPLRIKDIAHIAFYTLGALFAAAATISLIVSLTVISAEAIAGTILTISLIGLGTLAGLKLWELATPHLPECLRRVANIIQILVTEVLGILSLIALFPVDLTKSDPKTRDEINPEETPILMIHGFLGSSNNWVYHKSRLKAAGYQNVFSINLGNPLISIDEYARRVDAKVKEIQELTGRKDIRLLTHSMGGLVARQWRYTMAQDTDVKEIVTLGTPLDGTYVAYGTLGLSSCGKEMFPGSDFVKQQQEWAAHDQTTDYYHIATKTDLIILPMDSAKRGGSPGDKLKVDTLDATGHVGYLFSDKAADLVIDYFKAKDRHPGPVSAV